MDEEKKIAEISTKVSEARESIEQKPIIWLPIVIATSISVLICCAIVFGYHKQVTSKSKSFAIVDLNEIIQIKQLQFEEVLIKPNVTDKERMIAYDMVKNIGKELPEALVQLQGQCACVILAKNAVISGESLDLTDELKDILRLSGLNSKSMKEHLHAG